MLHHVNAFIATLLEPATVAWLQGNSYNELHERQILKFCIQAANECMLLGPNCAHIDRPEGSQAQFKEVVF